MCQDIIFNSADTKILKKPVLVLKILRHLKDSDGGGDKKKGPLNMTDHILIPGSWEYFTLQGKRNFADVITTEHIEKGDYPEFSKVT